jgi:thioredoxin reductase (NADPH)
VITPQDIASIPLFEPLSDDDRLLIASRAADIRLREGEWLIQEGEPASFFVLLAGELETVKRYFGVEQVILYSLPGTFFGEVPLLLGSAAVASLRASEPSRVMRLDPVDFHTLIAGQTDLSAEILRTMSRRLTGLQELGAQALPSMPRVIGRQSVPACHELRDFLFRNQVAFQWLDMEDPAAVPRIPAEWRDASVCPVVLYPDGTTMIEPTDRQVADRLGMLTGPQAETYDLAIVGGGPAGLAAAVYGASEGLRTLLVEQVAPGGQAGTSSKIENYLGFPFGITGDDLSHRALNQARRFGADIVVAREVTGLRLERADRAVVLDGGEAVRCRAMLIATGVSWRRLDTPGFDRLTSRGVYYGAARTEAMETQGKEIFLIGGGNSAGQAAMFFADYAKCVTILIRRESLSATMSQYLIDQLASKRNVRVEPYTEVVEARGENHLSAIVTKDVRTGEQRPRLTDSLFVFIGADARTDWLPAALALNDTGYLLTGRDVPRDEDGPNCWPLQREPTFLETSVPGVFAAGDVRCGSVKRVAAGVGEGSMAVAFVHQYLAEED